MNKEFALRKENLIIIAIGCVLLVVSFILMSGGGSEDPTVFSRDLFSFRRITLAPTISLIGYGVVMYGIMKKPKNNTDNK